MKIYVVTFYDEIDDSQKAFTTLEAAETHMKVLQSELPDDYTDMFNIEELELCQ